MYDIHIILLKVQCTACKLLAVASIGFRHPHEMLAVCLVDLGVAFRCPLPWQRDLLWFSCVFPSYCLLLAEHLSESSWTPFVSVPFPVANKIQYRNANAVVLQKTVRMYLAWKKHRPRYLGLGKLRRLKEQTATLWEIGEGWEGEERGGGIPRCVEDSQSHTLPVITLSQTELNLYIAVVSMVTPYCHMTNVDQWDCRL